MVEGDEEEKRIGNAESQDQTLPGGDTGRSGQRALAGSLLQAAAVRSVDPAQTEASVLEEVGLYVWVCMVKMGKGKTWA